MPPSGSFLPVAGAFNDDAGHHYDVMVEWTWQPGVSAGGANGFGFSDFYNLLSHLDTYTSAPDYDLNDNNCTTWAVDMLSNYLHINDIPQTEVEFPISHAKGLAPAQLGQDLRTAQPQNSYQEANEIEDSGTTPASTCDN